MCLAHVPAYVREGPRRTGGDLLDGGRYFSMKLAVIAEPSCVVIVTA